MKRTFETVWFFLIACVLLTLVAIGGDAVEVLALRYLGFRPIHASRAVLNGVWYIILVPLYLVAAGYATWRLVREPTQSPEQRRQERALRRMRAGLWPQPPRASVLALLVAATPVVGVCAWVFFTTIRPELRRGTQRDSWPADLELAAFDVCAIETYESLTNRTLAFGRVAFEVVNRSPHHLREATFTVDGGPQYQYTLQSLAPGGTRRVAVETELGPLWCGRRASRCRFNLLWDRVLFEGAPSVSLEETPANARTGIGDCPRFDVRGRWNGSDGSVLILNQVGTRVSGDLRDGPFSSYSSVIGQAKDGAVAGTLFSRSGPFLSEGTFSLTSRTRGELEGSWAFTKGNRAGESGGWRLARATDVAR